MAISRFENIIAWQKAKDLAITIYSLYSDCNDFGLKNQIQRASVSVMNNIAEGFERKSNNDFKQFLYIAKGSCGEVRTMLILSHDLKINDPEKNNALLNLSEENSRLISGLIKTL
ncbi:MAG TPA: four helix bundle protein [Bacteroidales bacterium]|nr:four helix bundle protein [Bacteroidales bacterium]